MTEKPVATDPRELPDVSSLRIGVLGGTGDQGRGLAWTSARGRTRHDPLPKVPCENLCEVFGAGGQFVHVAVAGAGRVWAVSKPCILSAH